jgi:transposase-like protein
MGLLNGKCDSCGEKTDVLFPVGILDELPTGGEAHVQRWYCVSCKDTLEEEAGEADNKADDDDEQPRPFNPK